MCRFVLLKSKEPILLADFLTRPAHSIINQSFDCRLRVDQRRPLNGDGFGVGWYAQDKVDIIEKTIQEILDGKLDLISIYTQPNGPCVFTSILPAWNNLNLIRLSEKISSRLVFAHVRAASPGFPISETNCHPWSFGKYLFMHNGFIANFDRIKRRLQNCLSEVLFHFVQGNTDSEWLFALFLQQLFILSDHSNQKSLLLMKQALLNTFELLNQWKKEFNIENVSLLNIAISDGQSTLVSRYVDDKQQEPASLFYASGSSFERATQDGEYRMKKSDRQDNLVIVSSEPLTYERTDWIPVPANTLLMITEKNQVLIHPIENEFYSSQPRSRISLSSSSPNVQQVWG